MPSFGITNEAKKANTSTPLSNIINLFKLAKTGLHKVVLSTLTDFTNTNLLFGQSMHSKLVS